MFRKVIEEAEMGEEDGEEERKTDLTGATDPAGERISNSKHWRNIHLLISCRSRTNRI